eukprot:g3461.t1
MPLITVSTSIPLRCLANSKSKENKSLSVRSRRALLLGSLPIGIGAAVEVAARPSITKPVQSRTELKTRTIEATSLLESAKKSYTDGNYSQAVDGFTSVIEMVPRNYILSMKALLGRRDAYQELGLIKKASSDARREFAWGRGIRWPGWYIISAILIRNQFIDD